MCVIAGYSGNRRAAPILIEMMKKIEYYDGGYGNRYCDHTRRQALLCEGTG